MLAKRLALMFVMFALLMPAAATPVLAQSEPLAALSQDLAAAESDIRSVDRSMDARMSDSDQKLAWAKVLAAKSSATDTSAKLQEQITLLDAKLEGLGPQPSSGEAPDIQRQRASLAKQRSAIDSAIKRGNLLAVEAQQLADEISESQAQELGEKLSTRSPSPLAPGFWSALAHAWPRDSRRAAMFVQQGRSQIAYSFDHGTPWLALLGLIVGFVILVPLRSFVRSTGRKMLTEGFPARSVRRSANALWRVLVGTLAPLLAGLAFVQGLRWASMVPPSWNALLGTFVAAAAFSGFTMSVLGALLMRSQPSWRIARLSDQAASRLRPYTIVLGCLAFCAIMSNALNLTLGTSATATACTQAILALCHILLIGASLVTLGRLRSAQASEGSGQVAAGLGLVNLLAWVAVGGAFLALLTGYFGFSLFVLQMIAWAVVLGAGVYLLMAAIDDVASTVFDRSSPFGDALVRSLGLRGSAIDQFGVLLSGILRVTVVILALGMLLSPFGAGNVDSLFGRLGLLAQGFEVGGVSVSPGALVRGGLVLFVGLALVRAFMRWLDHRYLPATDLDGSGRNSVSLVARYVGVALAVIWGLASLGIGVERIAILLSALSVGIGFGLQAITQNFVSGLILLAERPIKIGDLVRVGTDEGDVKRISVRSTEIELADHSTLIVPNSELITKTVLNKTLASPLGRLQIQFSVPIDVDADAVRKIVLETYAAEESVLSEPAPSVFIDSIADGRIFFNSFAHVATPRAAYGARSNSFATLLRRFRQDGIAIGTVPQRLELVGALPGDRDS
ncbi:small-conductance mechanosensitive channel [Novosphingobium sp. PhB57]|jgi:small-conductance mechanosensitive channel|uniref:DUF3772 domain-containing protein n=1 Tax=Novosphingobium sp. PhB57 TaxID=2485107 RepID=UPI0010F1759C|nr:DUF3772 domain-containing protein [Novosphingobium sp. PhB57]TCU57917.1 small-conductance mechanosensitive channel [Novosphingobium sp. PhB57]